MKVYLVVATHWSSSYDVTETRVEAVYKDRTDAIAKVLMTEIFYNADMMYDEVDCYIQEKELQ